MTAAERRIAYVAGVFPLRSETFVYREVRELRRRGWTVIAAGLNEPGEPTPAGLQDLLADRVVVYAGRWVARAIGELIGNPMRAARTLVRAARDALTPGEPMRLAARAKLLPQAIASLALARSLRPRGVRHVHCHFAHAATTVGMYAAMQLGVPFSFTGHANDLFQRRALLKRKLRRSAFASCISDWHRQFYEAIEPNRGGKYRVVRCGVDVDAWTPNGGVSSPTLRVLTLCRLVEKKGVDTLLRAVALARSHGMHCTLTIAGDGPDSVRLRSLADELRLGDAVRWLGAVENDEVVSLLAEADVFALPCRADANGDRDGIPVVLMEAMACGVPVVAGDLPAIGELVADNATGLLVDGMQPEQTAGAIERLARDAAARARLASAGRARVEQEFSLAANVDRLERAFAAALASR